MKKQKVKMPAWGSDEVIAKFWDTHNIADYWDELEPAKDVKFIKPKKELISVRLEPVYRRQLKAVAKKMGIGYTALARLLIIEELQRTQPPAR